MTVDSQFRGQAVTVAASIASVAGLLGILNYLQIPSLFQRRAKSRKVGPRCYSLNEQPSLTSFKALVERTTLKETYPLAIDVQNNIPIYDCGKLDLQDSKQVERFQDELYHVLVEGPGVYVLKHFFTDLEPVDAANEAFAAIIKRELEENGEKGDHFAAAGTNNRIWNSFSKLCLQDPESFVKYYSNPLFEIVCESYLGPAYRITSQVNIVKPGGKPQVSHRDYHLGFQTAEDVAKWPKDLHTASQLLTLQGAVAQSDMPLSSGPTRFLPYSQTFEEGYMAYRLPSFNDYFLQNWTSLPLKKGDAVFFSPALFHAAGENLTTDFNRSANLIQVSSAFGKTMETIDSVPLIEATYEILREKGWNEAFVRAVAEGYPFPTNLDRRPPAPGGMAPESEQDVLRKGLVEGWAREEVLGAMRKMRRDALA
ncbi:phytanoyl- dioxygenase family [Lecanosticta acicola]|uniref:Phytanoyl- dioxygenase family n=1 Tax=Lecanosticta acicola TaxID=111012 RepID=A0AAI8YVY1_9PEZI|nr:phytanoyl- dioxygenase family [Lecanosticta acicola]